MLKAVKVNARCFFTYEGVNYIAGSKLVVGEDAANEALKAGLIEILDLEIATEMTEEKKLEDTEDAE